MKRINGKDLLKISELAEQAGVSPSTIHYYVQEGLLTPPLRTGRNMAYYDPSCIQEIRAIQELQTKRYLPLSAIKLLMKAQKDGQAPHHLVEMRSFMEEVFQPLQTQSGPRNITWSELISLSGVPETDLVGLKSSGTINPNPGTGSYSEFDLEIARLFKNISGYGVKAADLEILKPYIETIRVESRAMHTLFHRLPDHNNIPIRELLKSINQIKGFLALRTTREEAETMLMHGPKETPKA